MAFTFARMPLTTSSLHNNPFAILGVTVKDDRRTIVEQAEHKSLLLDADVCQLARSALTNPKNRIAAEIAWLPGVAPERATRLLENLLTNAMSTRQEKNLPPVSHCNLMAAAFDGVSIGFAPNELAEFILEFATMVDECHPDEIATLINEDRKDAGFSAILNQDVVEAELRERKRAFNHNIKEALDRLPSQDLLETLSITVRYATAEGSVTAPELINTLIDSYDVEIQPVLEQEKANVERLLSAIRDQIYLGEASLFPLINGLERVVGNWDRFARPVQLIAMTRGIDHGKSVDVAWSIRQLGVDLFNEHDMLNAVTRLTEIEEKYFSLLPEFIEKIKEDKTAIADFHAERLAEEQKDAQWKASITYSASVGMVFKHKLSISSEGIHWDGSDYLLEDINAIRFGAIRKSVNGVPTGTTFTIGFSCLSGKTATVTLGDEKVYSGFQAALWRAVGIRLLVKMLQDLDVGERMTFGSFIVDDAGVTLFQHKFWGGTEKVRMGWYDVVVSSGNGEFVIRSKHDKKTYGSASYINDWNTHIIEHIIRGAFEKGVRNLSDYLKN